MKRSPFARLAPLAAGLVLALACFGRSPAQTGALAPLRIATPGNDGNAMAWYAQDTGIFQKHGLTADVQAIRRGSGSAIAAAVASGAVDIGEGDLVAIATARAHGIPLTMLAPSFLYKSSLPISVLVVAKTDPITSAKDLNGKVIGVLSLEGPAKIATQKWLESNGADISTIKFVEITPTTAAPEVARGQIAAATINEPSLTPAFEITREFGDPFDSLGKQVQVSAWFAKDDWIRANSAIAKRFVDAMHETAVWANTPANYAKSAAILQKYDDFPTDLIGHMRRASYGESFDVTTMQPLLDSAVQQKSIPGHVDAKDLISTIALVK